MDSEERQHIEESPDELMARKLAVLRESASLNLPTSEIEEILRDIEIGRTSTQR